MSETLPVSYDTNSGLQYSTDGGWISISGGGNGIAQLTGDVTAGPGGGSQAATVVSVGGKTAAQVATGVNQAAAALPEAGGTMTGAFIPWSITTTARDALMSVTAGTLIYNTTTNKLNFYNGTGWEVVTSA